MIILCILWYSYGVECVLSIEFISKYLDSLKGSGIFSINGIKYLIIGLGATMYPMVIIIFVCFMVFDSKDNVKKTLKQFNKEDLLFYIIGPLSPLFILVLIFLVPTIELLIYISIIGYLIYKAGHFIFNFFRKIN